MEHQLYQGTGKDRLLAGVTMAAVAILAAPPTGAEGLLVEEVVVTAQRREQRLADVGISVTAFTGEQLRELGIFDSTDLVAQTPGLQVSGAGGGTVNTYSIRGVTQNDFSAAQEAPVAAYVDEAYVSQNFATGFSLFDIDRVEVLRGPQGTLFGRNATGGLVHFVTVRPSAEPEAFVEGQIGQQGRRRIEAAFGGGLSDTVSARLSGVLNESDGLIDNAVGRDVRAREDWALRGQLLIEPSDQLNVLLKVQHADEDSTRGGYAHSVALNGEFVADPTATDFFGYRDADGDPYSGAYDFGFYRRAEVSEYAMQVNWSSGDVQLTSITNFQDLGHRYGEDSDASPNSVYNYEADDDVDQFSQELRLTWSGSRHQSVLGLYYLSIEGDYATFQSGDAFFGPDFRYDLAAEQQTDTIALFAQTDLDLSERVALTAGVRLNRDEKDYAFAELGTLLFTDDFENDDVSAKLQLDFRPHEDWLLYGGVSRGIKSGGFNMPLGPPADFATFEYGGEALIAYEIGAKGSFGATTRLNASLFDYDYEDYQAYTFDGFVPLLFNAEARLQGGEIELVTSPLPGLELLLGVAYLDGEVEDVPASISPSGSEDPVLAPRLSLNGLIRYGWNAFGGRLAVQADYAWQDDQTFNLSFTPVIEEEAYGVLNASLLYTSADDRWYGIAFVRNVTDEEYRSYAFDTTAFFGATEDVIGVERWSGLTVGWRM